MCDVDVTYDSAYLLSTCAWRGLSLSIIFYNTLLQYIQ